MPRIASHPSFPSVTEILGATGLTRDYRGLDDRYSLLGTALHEMIAAHGDGYRGEWDVHPEVKPGWEAYLEWVEQASHQALYSEYQLVDEGLGVVGRLDRFGSVGSVEHAIVDWTYSSSPDLKGKKYQVAGYALMWMRAHPEMPAQRWYVVALGKDGVPRCHDVTDDYAMQVFCGAVIVEKAKREK